MSGANAGPAAVSLLTLALLISGFSCLGLLVMKGFYNKLHYLAPTAILGTAAIALAIILEEGFNASALKAGLVLLVIVVTNPVLTHAAARAHYLREKKKKVHEGGRGAEGQPGHP